MNTDHLAPFYQVLETLAFGPLLQRCRLAHLDQIPAPQHILLAGEGHGRSLRACAKRFPDARITVIDSSARMLEIARRKSPAEHITFLHTDLLAWQAPARHFDLIVTHFILDCLDESELPEVIETLARSAAPDAHWLIADFEIPESGPAKLAARTLLKTLYLFFKLTTRLRAGSLVPPDPHLRTNGFTLKSRQTHAANILKAELWQRPVNQCSSSTLQPDNQIPLCAPAILAVHSP
ncbi:MAG: class I SAM-dependent methyltransferase [Verrucomicrobiales bacterium]|nr:class I SAM-dependent methyltransferase [Verrucomicrobiota bacterium JB025]